MTMARSGDAQAADYRAVVSRAMGEDAEVSLLMALPVAPGPVALRKTFRIMASYRGRFAVVLALQITAVLATLVAPQTCWGGWSGGSRPGGPTPAMSTGSC